MNEIKQKADALIEAHSKPMPFRHPTEIIEHVVISTENIIKVLEEVKQDILDNLYKANLDVFIKEQNAILSELKTRL